jgi:hypothetical protein
MKSKKAPFFLVAMLVVLFGIIATYNAMKTPPSDGTEPPPGGEVQKGKVDDDAKKKESSKIGDAIGPGPKTGSGSPVMKAPMKGGPGMPPGMPGGAGSSSIKVFKSKNEPPKPTDGMTSSQWYTDQSASDAKLKEGAKSK